MWIAEFTNYKVFLKALIKTYPGKGRGQGSRLSEHLKISRLAVSQILNHERHFTIDQAIETTKFYGFDEMATEYFVAMVNQARAETKDGKAFFGKKMDKIREEALKIRSQVQGRQILSEKDMGVFYSNWYYAGVALLVSVKGFQSVDSIASYLKMSRTKVAEIVSFLVNVGILVDEGGSLSVGKAEMFISEPSPYLHNHTRNWRLKAIESSMAKTPDDINVTIPVSISKKDAVAIRAELHKFIKKFSSTVKDSKEEKIMCLNIDWFSF